MTGEDNQEGVRRQKKPEQQVGNGGVDTWEKPSRAGKQAFRRPKQPADQLLLPPAIQPRNPLYLLQPPTLDASWTPRVVDTVSRRLSGVSNQARTTKTAGRRASTYQTQENVKKVS